MDRENNYLNLEDVLSGKFDKCLAWLCLLTKEDGMQVTIGSLRILYEWRIGIPFGWNKARELLTEGSEPITETNGLVIIVGEEFEI
jgi:hypothetical protein